MHVLIRSLHNHKKMWWLVQLAIWWCHATGDPFIWYLHMCGRSRGECRFEHILNYLCISSDRRRRRQANFLRDTDAGRDTVRTRGWLMGGLRMRPPLHSPIFWWRVSPRTSPVYNIQYFFFQVCNSIYNINAVNASVYTCANRSDHTKPNYVYVRVTHGSCKVLLLVRSFDFRKII
jgi:hypothetical protein